MHQDAYNINVLLVVWGEGFIKDFLKFSLPSLLAPGNIPALTKEHNVKFVILTRASQSHFFEENPVFQQLKALCKIEFLAIDELIVLGNYSTTVTLAYDHAIKNTGEQMLDTYFIFLVSDYIMADGSMEGLLRYINKGYSGICAGNFQVLQEDFEEYILDQIDPDTNIMQVKPRELLKKSFEHLHPIVIASIFDQTVLRNYHANRFYHRYNTEILAGRFYLLHMLCIKPETMNYKVGASCDYSFIPEMCPSGNIGIINDSDDYLVVEIQPKDHELIFIDWGQYDFNHLITMLSEWTIEQHRQNSQQTIYFHTRDILPEEKNIIEEKLNNFVSMLSKKLDRVPPKPFYNHPYWIGAFESFAKQQQYMSTLGCNDYDYFGLSLYSYATNFPKRLVFRLFGIPPKAFAWHYRFEEFRMMRNLLVNNVNQNLASTVFLYDTYQLDFMRYCDWIKRTLKDDHHYHLRNLLANRKKFAELQREQFKLCVLFVRIDDIAKLTGRLESLKKLLTRDCKLLLIVPNEKNRYSSAVYDFRAELGQKLNTIFNSSYRIVEVNTIHSNLTMLGTKTIAFINKIFSYSRKRRALAFLLVGPIGSLFCFIANCMPKFFKNKGHCTNVILTLKREI